jgi:acyl-CoA thioesterase II
MPTALRPLLDLEPLDRDLFRGKSPDEGRDRVFGGQVASQALVAAVRTVEHGVCHSFHSYFLRPGDPKRPILYAVDRIRDGRTFTTRRVNAIQNGEAIFTMIASFQTEESGLEHQAPMPEAPPPESVPSIEQLLDMAAKTSSDPMLQFLAKLERPITVHDLDPIDPRAPRKREGTHLVWFKAKDALPDDPLLHQCVLTYASDYTLLDASLHVHGRTWFDRKLQVASVDHSIWFHRRFRADDWLLYATESLTTSGARGMNKGLVFKADGTHVATVMQENLMRERA